MTRIDIDAGESIQDVPYKFAISRSHPTLYVYGRVMCTWLYSVKVGTRIGSRRNIFLDPLARVWSLPAANLFPRVCACAHVCVYMRCAWWTEVLQKLFVSGGYAKHSKLPPKNYGRFSVSANEVKREIRIPQMNQNILR